MASKSQKKKYEDKITELTEASNKKDVLMLLCLDFIKMQYDGIKQIIEDGDEDGLFPKDYFGELSSLLQTIKKNLPEGMGADRFKDIID